MKFNSNPVAQGDILIMTGMVSKTAVVMSSNICASSQTGHHHIINGDATLWRDLKEQQKLWLRVGAKGAILQHLKAGGHEDVELPEGEYVLHRQREGFSPEVWQQVED